MLIGFNLENVKMDPKYLWDSQSEETRIYSSKAESGMAVAELSLFYAARSNSRLQSS